MKHKGIELKEITKPQVFDPPKQMFVWDKDVNCDEPLVETVYAVIRTLSGTTQAVGRASSRWLHCAEIPEEPKPRLATNRELSKWITNNGELTYDLNTVYHEFSYNEPDREKPVEDGIFIRKWEDTEWHEPTVDYMRIEDKPAFDHNVTSERIDGERKIGEADIWNMVCWDENFFRENEVKIGNQTWMNKNLDVSDGGEGIYYNKDNGEYYYTWEAAKRIADKIPGWHLPSRGEWDELLAVVKTRSLMQENRWVSIFDVKPTGYWYGIFISDGTTTNFWSSSIDELGESTAWRLYMSNTPYSSWESRRKALGFSVRLVKDK